MAKCTQCEKNAMYELQGHLLCLDCYYKFHKMNMESLNQLVLEENFLLAQMEATAGIPGLFPRRQVMQTPHIDHSININNSTVGAINTGTIDNLNVNLSVLADQQKDLANTLAEFVQNVLNNDLIEKEYKEVIVENIDFIAEQLSGETKPRKSIIMSSLKTISGILNVSAALLTLWSPIQETIATFL